MDSLEDPSCWDFLDYTFINESASSSDFLWSHDDIENTNSGGNGGQIGISPSSQLSQDKECGRKRGRVDSSSRPVTKACREKLRRERLNDRFLDLSAVLDPGRAAQKDKPAILDDAIRVLNQLKSEALELKELNEKLLEEIKCLKTEKNELREEKLTLKADKERMEHQLKVTSVPASGFVHAHPAAYQAAPNKMAVFPSYGLIPMWQYLPPAACDTSRDHELRPPAA
ncbi:hypothetical protein K2173_001434 [Erythroxylum novogranatense]|uniref:BHLH domain-containing protein n=1 Tax=Erythroxylum novogranatense TaxID=1862640 RepID=A0AAV8T911_9ROSI|nr:hypothetical protein K2173_001434 [Erythroxylum novogranatense]